ncbi:MAG TPA: LytTR family DNA-binding domain-containing protein [Saprospiraceae bacterium]|nr:LytTR family DNA-binding domain-containing protein [Saprospiraceae bacterium]
MNISVILNKPHPFIFNGYSVLLPSLITFLLLLILKPFEFDTFSIFQLLSWSVFFALVVGLTVFSCVTVLKKYFRSTIEDHWTVKREFLLILFVLAAISLVIFGLFLIINPEFNKFELFQLVVVRTIGIGFFPVLVLVLYEQNHHQKIKRQQAEQLNRELLKREETLPPRNSNPTVAEKIVLLAENEKIALQVAPARLCYAKSEGNYVEVFYLQNEKIKKHLIRNSLKSIEEQLSAYDFFRCHNRFLINLSLVQKVEGNSRNFELVLENIEEKIPVSRSKSKELLKWSEPKN